MIRGGHSRARIAGRSALTLIELLVVVGILSILAGLLLPSFRNARDTSKRVQCMNNLRQVGLATQMLANDHGGYIDGSPDHLADPADEDQTINAVAHYLRGDRLTAQGKGGCPGMDARDTDDWPFGWNLEFASSIGYMGATPRHSLNEVRYPARIFLVADNWFCLYTSNNHPDWTLTGYSTFGDGTRTYERHRMKGLNYYFVDGHGQWLKAKGPLVILPGPTYGELSDWWIWGDLTGDAPPYAKDWADLAGQNLPWTSLFGQ